MCESIETQMSNQLNSDHWKVKIKSKEIDTVLYQTHFVSDSIDK